MRHMINLLFILFICMAASVNGQTLTSPLLQDTTVAPKTLNLNPAPDILDWRPRERAVVGGTLVLKGTALRPADLKVTVGPNKFRLPVRLATSTPTHVEVEIPDAAVQQSGVLIATYPGSIPVTLETNLTISLPTPTITSANAGADVYPHLLRQLTIEIKEFPGAQLDPGSVVSSGSCDFRKHSGVSYGRVSRAADLSLRFSLAGWFASSGGPCQLQFYILPLDANGATTLPAILLRFPFTVNVPQSYTFNSTSAFASILAPTLVQFGLGNICSGTLLDGKIVGVTGIGGDFAIIERGGPLDVSCNFRTREWLLPEGVTLKSITWRVSRQGNRCGLPGNFTQTLPSQNYVLNRGTVTVLPEANMTSTDFIAFGEREIIKEGVTFATGLNAPRTMLLPMTLGFQCASTLVPLQTSSGTSAPTGDPQSFAIILDSIELAGPPGLSLP